VAGTASPGTRTAPALETTARLQEAQEAQHGKAARRCESLALLQAQLEHEQVEQAQRDKIESLKAHLSSVVDRTTRIRGAYEKEKKQLTSQARSLLAMQLFCVQPDM
jgi:hypothetical protein